MITQAEEEKVLAIWIIYTYKDLHVIKGKLERAIKYLEHKG